MIDSIKNIANEKIVERNEILKGGFKTDLLINAYGQEYNVQTLMDVVWSYPDTSYEANSKVILMLAEAVKLSSMVRDEISADFDTRIDVKYTNDEYYQDLVMAHKVLSLNYSIAIASALAK